MSVGNFFKKTLPHMALAVASGIPGPVGAVAQIINTVIPQPAGAAPIPAEPSAINSAVEGATPDQLTAMRAKDQDFAVQMKQLGIQEVSDWESFVAEDRASARQMQVATRSWMPSILAYGAVLTLMGCIYMLGFRTLPQTGHDALMLLLGGVIAIVKDVYGYVFGGSAGESEKTTALASIAAGNGK